MMKAVTATISFALHLQYVAAGPFMLSNLDPSSHQAKRADRTTGDVNSPHPVHSAGGNSSSSSSSSSPSCPAKYYNKDLHAENVFELSVNPDVVLDIKADYERDVKPYLNGGKSTEDFCLVTPYDDGNDTWDTGDKRSDIKWWSVNNERTYLKYLRHVERLGLKDAVRGTWINSDVVTVYAMFFITRSRSVEYQMHLDWSEECHTQVVNILVPLKDFDINLAYEDVDGEIRHYDYRFGKAVGFGGGFMHSTGIGEADPEDVMLCVYLGSDDPTIWEYARENIADELEHYMSPLKGFVRNEEYGDKRICN